MRLIVAETARIARKSRPPPGRPLDLRSSRMSPRMPTFTRRSGIWRVAAAWACSASRTRPPQHGTSMMATVSERMPAWSIIAVSFSHVDVEMLVELRARDRQAAAVEQRRRGSRRPPPARSRRRAARAGPGRTARSAAPGAAARATAAASTRAVAGPGAAPHGVWSMSGTPARPSRAPHARPSAMDRHGADAAPAGTACARWPARAVPRCAATAASSNSGRLALDHRQRAGRALAEARPQAVAEHVRHQARLAVDHLEGALGAGRHALAAAVAECFVNLDDVSERHHGMILYAGAAPYDGAQPGLGSDSDT